MRHFHMHVGPLLTTPRGMHHYGPFVSGCMFVHVASVWEELCRSRGLDNWLVLECQMAEEGIIVDSSCSHEVEVGVWRPQVKGKVQSFFCEWALRLFWPPPQFSPAGVLLWRGDGNLGTWQQAADLAPLSSSLSSLSFSPSWPSYFIFFSCSVFLPVCPLPSLVCFVPCLIFHGIYFILRPPFLSLEYGQKEHPPPLHLSKWNIEGGRKRETKKAKK